MNCPHCHESLVMIDKQGVEIDYCPTCRGVWLDKGELDKLMEKSRKEKKREQDVEETNSERGGKQDVDSFLNEFFNFG